MNILLDYKSPFPSHNGLNKFICIIDVHDLGDIYQPNSKVSGELPFAIRINLIGDDSQLINIINDSIFALFNPHYFYFLNRPLIIVECTDVKIGLNKKINTELSKHGFEDGCLLILNGISNLNLGASFCKYIDIKDNVEELEANILKMNTLIVCYSNIELEELLSKQNSVLTSDRNIMLLYDELKSISAHNEKLKLDLNWQRSQVNNHKAYLEVLKIRVSQGAMYEVYMRFVSIINKLGPIRKIAKYYHSLIFKKRE